MKTITGVGLWLPFKFLLLWLLFFCVNGVTCVLFIYILTILPGSHLFFILSSARPLPLLFDYCNLSLMRGIKE